MSHSGANRRITRSTPIRSAPGLFVGRTVIPQGPGAPASWHVLPQLSLSSRERRNHGCLSQVPTEDVHACLGSSTPQGRTGPHPVGPARVAFDLIDGLGTPELKYFGAQSPRPHAPLPTLHLPPRDDRRTARGGSWLVRPCSQRTFTSSLLPVGLALRQLLWPPVEPIVFFGGKSYVPLFCKLTAAAKSTRIVYYSGSSPSAPGCKLRSFGKPFTNWHYKCASAFVDAASDSLESE